MFCCGSQCEDFEECLAAGGCAIKYFEERMTGTEPESDEEYADPDAGILPDIGFRIFPSDNNLLDFLQREDEQE